VPCPNNRRPLIALNIEFMLEEEGVTSFDVAATETDAITAAMANRPQLITSDVKLLAGTGPAAVSEIHRRIGDVPVIFITGTPEDCKPCNPPGIVLRKPFAARELRAAFNRMV
jgi:CheY-like chemotaxis protein